MRGALSLSAPSSLCFKDSDDVKNVDLTKVHNLSGPIAVEGAEPGDCLVVDILDVTPFEKMPWGYTVCSSKESLAAKMLALVPQGNF